MMKLLHAAKDPAAEVVVLIAEGDDQDDIQDHYEEDGYDVTVYDMRGDGEWPSGLPTGRALTA